MICPNCGPVKTKELKYKGAATEECTICGRVFQLFVDVDLTIVDVRPEFMSLLVDTIPSWMKARVTRTELRASGPTTQHHAVRLLADLKGLSCYPWELRVTYVGSGTAHLYTNGGEDGKDG